MTRPGTIFIVDDDAAVRNSLALMLETVGYTVLAFGHAREFLGLCGANCQTCRLPGMAAPSFPGPSCHCEGCLILDVSIPDMNGPELQRQLLQRGVRLPTIFLSGFGTIPMTVQAMRNGALDFLTKPVDMAHLLRRIEEALQKSRTLKRQASIHHEAHVRLSGLTAREREIMGLIVEGLSSKEAALRLNISHRTVEVHRTRLMKKTGAACLRELVQLWDAAGKSTPVGDSGKNQ